MKVAIVGARVSHTLSAFVVACSWGLPTLYASKLVMEMAQPAAAGRNRSLSYSRRAKGLGFQLGVAPCFAEYPVEDLVRGVDGFVDCRTGGDHPDIDLSLPGKPDAGDQTRTEVDQTAVEAGHARVRIEHRFTIAKKRRTGIA